MFVIKNKKYFFILSLVLVVLSFASLLVFKLKPSIEFTGGAIVEVVYPNGRPEQKVIVDALKNAGFEGSSVRPVEQNEYAVRTKFLSETDRQNIVNILSLGGTVQMQEKSISSIGPAIGKELKTKAITGLSLVVLCTILFIAFAFRKVSEPISSWKFGLIAIIALLHDVILPIGFFALLGHFAGAEVDVLFVTAVLTAFGLSITDTIVVFDRIREHLKVNKEKSIKEDFAELVGKSLNETFARSFNTSMTVILVLLSLFFLGGETTKYFSLTLIIGMIAGTYSSIFLASPMLVVAKNWQDKKAERISEAKDSNRKKK